jgi:hypothetical protein
MSRHSVPFTLVVTTSWATKVEVTLQLTVSQSVCRGVKPRGVKLNTLD